MLKIEKISESMSEAGFDVWGVARAEPLSEAQTRFEDWLSEGHADGIDYLQRNIDMRFSPQKLVEGARSVIVGAVGYKNTTSAGYPADSEAKIASYARCRDYHLSLKEMLHKVAAELKLAEGKGLKICVDSVPIAEKIFARQAGIGWIGRNSLVVNKRLGSFMVLGEIVTTEECDSYSSPCEDNGCVGCGRCLLRCPTGAILPKGGINTRRCISNRTIESRTEKGFDTHGWLFGCDECQSCCPHNAAAPLFRNPLFEPVFNPDDYDRQFWDNISEQELKEKFGQTPLLRALARKASPKK